MMVTMTKIKTGVLGSKVVRNSERSRSLIPVSEYRIADIFSKINPADKYFLKYVPDGFRDDVGTTRKTAQSL